MSLLLTYFLFYSQMLRRELTITFFFLFIKMDTLESSAWTLSGSLSHIGPGQVSPFTKVPKSLEHFCLKTLMIIFFGCYCRAWSLWKPTVFLTSRCLKVIWKCLLGFLCFIGCTTHYMLCLLYTKHRLHRFQVSSQM